MKLTYSKRPNLKMVAALAAASLALVAAQASIRTAAIRERPPATAPAAVTEVEPAAAAPVAAPIKDPLQVVRFALYDAGILPREARVASGRVVISIKDFTGGTAGLVVERGEGQERRSAGVVRRAGAHWRGRQELNLPPGTYYLYDSSRTQNRATLVVGQ